MNQEKLINAKNLFFIALGIDMAVTVLVVITDTQTLDILNDIKAGVSREYPSSLGTRETWGAIAGTLTTMGVGFALVRWLGACYEYAKGTLKATGFIQEKWKIWGWCIIGFSQYKPYQLITEIYKAGATDYTGGDDWKKLPSSGMLLFWWIFYAITHLIIWSMSKHAISDSIDFYSGLKNLTLNQAIDIYTNSVALCVISLIIAALWFPVSWWLTQRLLGRSAAIIASMKQVLSQSSNVSVGSAAEQAVVSEAIDLARYKQAADEVVSGARDEALWYKAFAEASGDEQTSKAAYIRLRVEQLRRTVTAPVDMKAAYAPVLAVDSTSNKIKTKQLITGWVSLVILTVVFTGIYFYTSYGKQKVAQPAPVLTQQPIATQPAPVLTQQPVATQPAPQEAQQTKLVPFDGKLDAMPAHTAQQNPRTLATAADEVDADLIAPKFTSAQSYGGRESKCVIKPVMTDDQIIACGGQVKSQMVSKESSWEDMKRAAENGNAEAQKSLATTYLYGKIVPKDIKAALYWFEKAASAGQPNAQTSLGWAYMSDYLELVPDYRLAMEWNLKAATQGFGEGSSNIGLLYENGWGVPVNYVEAANWYWKAINQGAHSGQAQLQLGGLYENGLGVEKDLTLAARMYQTVIEKFGKSKFADKAKVRLEAMQRNIQGPAGAENNDWRRMYYPGKKRGVG